MLLQTCYKREFTILRFHPVCTPLLWSMYYVPSMYFFIYSITFFSLMRNPWIRFYSLKCAPRAAVMGDVETSGRLHSR